MQLNNMLKFSSKQAIFTKNIVQKESRQTNFLRTTKFQYSFHWNHHERKFFPTKNNVKVEAFSKQGMSGHTLTNVYYQII